MPLGVTHSKVVGILCRNLRSDEIPPAHLLPFRALKVDPHAVIFALHLTALN